MREITFKVTFYCSCRICCGRYSPQSGGAGLTARGNQPIPFGTVAVGDPDLMGRWIYFEDLGRWVLASDTGAPCTSPQMRNRQSIRAATLVNMNGNNHQSTTMSSPSARPSSTTSKGCVGKKQVDIFIGGSNLHQRALELGVQEWVGKVFEPAEQEVVNFIAPVGVLGEFR